MQSKVFKLLFKEKIYQIPLMFKHIVDIPLKISEILVFSPSHLYQVESKASEEAFQAFIEYMVDDKLPDINISNIHDFLQLSQEFNILEDYVKSKILQFGEYLVNLNGLLNKEIHDASFYEEQIAVKLDDYLLKYGQNLMKSPIHSLFNIFNHPNRKLTKFDLCYELILKHFELTNDSKIFVLLESIDGTKLSKSHLEDAIASREKRMNHMPTIQFNYLAEAVELQGKLQSQVSELNEKIVSLQKQHEKDMSSLIRRSESEKEEMVKQNEACVGKLAEKFEAEIKKLAEKIEKDKKDSIDAFQSEIKSLQQKYSNDVELLKKENESLRKKIEDKDKKLAEKERGIDCTFKGDQLSGIISYLKQKYGGDLEKKGVLKLNDPGISSSYPVARLLMYDSGNINEEYDNQSCGEAKQSDGWFEIDFKNKKINLTSYTIRTSPRGPDGYCHPKSWRIVGSNDQNKWDLLNHQVNNSSLNGRYFQNHFTCENNHCYYRYIRYIQEDSFDSYKFNIRLTCFELFGYICD